MSHAKQLRWVRCAVCVAALSGTAAICCGAAREKTAGPSTPLRLAQGRSGAAQDDRSVGGRRSAKKSVPLTPWEQAEQGRDALESIPQENRTPQDYSHAMDAYRAIYHANPADVHAPSAVNAVAELLAEQGRTLHDEKSLRAAVGQYEFLRTQYPASSLGVQALLAEGQIEQNDLQDAEAARERYKLLLKEHPKSEQVEEARAGLASLDRGTGNRKQGTVKTGQVTAAGDRVSVAKHQTATSVADQPTHPTPLAKPAATPVRDTAATRGAPAVRSTKSGVSSLPVTAQTGGTADPTHRDMTAMDGAPSTPADQPDTVAGGKAQNGKPALVTGIRHWSTATYTRVAIDLGDSVTYEAARVPNPDRIYFDLHGTRLSPELVGKSFAVTDDGFLKRVRAAQFSDDVTRVVLDVNDVTEYSAFLLPNPYRLIIDIHGGKAVPAEASMGAPQRRADPAPTVPNTIAVKQTSSAEVAAVSDLPGRVEATSKPTSKPISAVVESEGPGLKVQDASSAATDANTADAMSAGVTPTDAGPYTSASSVKKTRRSKAKAADVSSSVADATPARAAVPTADGQTSLVRALGLKIGRIVIDAGHGGHDSGTIGADGIEEKDVVLDVALRLGKLLHDRLGAEIIYTRSDDTFVPLETRTAIANKAQADLFLSIHANSSPDESARGVETYYLNFTSDPTALDVAARENAVSDQSIHQLSDLVKKIALKDKIAESREFAGDVEGSLYAGLQKGNPGLKDRGVKKAPFVVLIGANMPSILAEISFVTNPRDAQQLRDPEYRERVAESLYKGIARYQSGLSGTHVATERASLGQ